MLAAMILGVVSIGGATTVAASEQDVTIRVRYYGTETTFEALFATGEEVHCVTEQTRDLSRRGVFNPAIDKVLCFDTIAEVDREFVRMRSSLLGPAESAVEPQGIESTDWFALYRQSFYNDWWYDLSSDNPNVTQPIWSVWENGNAAMRVYKGTSYTGNSWLITESIGTLGGGWGGTIKSIDWL
jgi:hypothetical protein